MPDSLGPDFGNAGISPMHVVEGEAKRTGGFAAQEGGKRRYLIALRKISKNAPCFRFDGEKNCNDHPDYANDVVPRKTRDK
jgi:hypothetical protein